MQSPPRRTLKTVAKSYGSKGQNVVDMNNAAIDLGMDALQEIIVPDHWAYAEEEEKRTAN